MNTILKDVSLIIQKESQELEKAKMLKHIESQIERSSELLKRVIIRNTDLTSDNPAKVAFHAGALVVLMELYSKVKESE